MYEPLMLKLDLDEKMELDEHDSKSFNSISTSVKTVIEIPTDVSFDSLSDNDRIRRALTTVFNDQNKELDNIRLTDLDSITGKKNPTRNNELSSEKNIDDEVNKNTILRFVQSLENKLKGTVGNADYKIKKYDRLQETDT